MKKCRYVGNPYSERPIKCKRLATFEIEDVPGWKGLDLSAAFVCEEHLKLFLKTLPGTAYRILRQKNA
jgi:hypothetical protein